MCQTRPGFIVLIYRADKNSGSFVRPGFRFTLRPLKLDGKRGRRKHLKVTFQDTEKPTGKLKVAAQMSNCSAIQLRGTFELPRYWVAQYHLMPPKKSIASPCNGTGADSSSARDGLLKDTSRPGQLACSLLPQKEGLGLFFIVSRRLNKNYSQEGRFRPTKKWRPLIGRTRWKTKKK